MNIRDIARIAGVSASTVSKILNKNDGDISEATREKVLKIVQEYHYIPHSQVRKAMIVRNYRLGVWIVHHNSGHEELLSAIEREASNAGYSVIAYYEKNIRKGIEALKMLDGMIFIGDMDECPELAEGIKIRRIPCVVIGFSKKSYPGIASFIYEEEEAAYQAVSYLIGKGHMNIGCVVLENSLMDRGCRRALYEHGIECNNSNMFTEDIIAGEGKSRLSEWIGLRNTAIFCSDVERTIYVQRALTNRGLVIPEDVSIISGKDSRYFSLFKPAVSAVRSCEAELAMRAVQMMLAQIGGTQEDIREFTAAVQIEERESVAVPRRNKGQKLVIVGSLNMDINISVPHIPEKGEAIAASGTVALPGGKGANQAVGVGKLAGKAYLIGCLGSDSDGQELYANLQRYRVRTEGIVFDYAIPTGKAYISIPKTDDGDSTIVVYPGANGALSRKYVEDYEYLFEDARYCLLSMEIPVGTVQYVADACRRRQVELILKPSGAAAMNQELLESVSYLIPNRKELFQLVLEGRSVEEKAEILCQMGVKNVIVTLGREGCYLKNEKYSRFFKAAEFESVDTTGGSDAFISTLAVYLSEGIPLIQAIGYATYSAGITVTRKGVQAAMPDRAALEMYQDAIMAEFTE